MANRVLGDAAYGRHNCRSVASGHSFDEILKAYPYLEEEDLREALTYAAWRVEEIEAPLAA